MRPYVLPFALATATAVFTLSLKEANHRDGPGRKVGESFASHEVQRIRAHFDSVSIELASRDVSELTVSQRARRSSLVTTLRAYRERGAFPRNYDFPGRAVPYFVDRETGVLCAVAHLLESTGRRDIVDRVASADNNVWVPQLAGDTAFTGWLDGHGLTLAEAARIQVPYENTNTAPYLVASMAALAVTVPTSVYNATANRNGKTDVVNFVGVLGGLSAIGLALAGANQDAPFALAAANLGAGAAAMFTSLVSHSRYVRTAKERREAERERAVTTMRRIETTVSPTLSLAGDRSAGIALTVRF